MPLTTGTRLGPYEVVAPIGAGGMGEVYRARDTRLNRDVAIKVLPESFAADADRRARFEREAQAVAALSHPNIVSIFDTGLHGGQLFVVTELLEGETLREKLQTGALPVRKAIDIAVYVARGLAAAHDKHLVHRDLKPENVFLLRDGQVKILDFGLARQMATGTGATETVAAMTDPGMVMGTVGYMAPEQVRGQAVDARTDLFALGAVLYEMISGRRAFQRETSAETMTAILRDDPPDLGATRVDLSPALDRIVRHCLEKNPAERFQTARDVAFALEAFSGSRSAGTSGPAVELADGPGRPTRLRLAVLSLAVASLAGLVFWAGHAWARWQHPNVQPTSRRLTFDQGFVFAARFAAGGQRIVYSANWSDRPPEIFETSLDSPASRPLNLVGADLLALSGAGELAILRHAAIGYSSYDRIGTLARGVSLNGGAPTDKSPDVRFADWAPDGQQLAVVRDERGEERLEFPLGNPVYSTSVQSIFNPRVAPSRERVAFFEDLERETASVVVCVVDRAGKKTTLTAPFRDWWGLAWSPSGDEVWFAATEPGAAEQPALFAVDMSGHQRLIWRIPGLFNLHDVSSLGEVLVSRDSFRLFVESLAPAADVTRDLSQQELSNPVALSADGRVVLIRKNGDSGGERGSAYLANTDGTPAKWITAGAPYALSPNGEWALVGGAQPPHAFSLVPTGIGEQRPFDVGDNQTVEWAGWHPTDPTRIVISGREAQHRIRISVLSTAGGMKQPISPEGFSVPAFSGNVVSPDGSRVAAIDPDGAIVLCALDGTGCRAVPGRKRGELVAGWADDRTLYVFRQGQLPALVDRVDVESGQGTSWRTIHPVHTAGLVGLSFLSVARNGTCVFYYGQTLADLYLITGLK